MAEAIDRDLLHRYLWNRADRLGRIHLVQTKLAEDLGVTKYTVSRIMREFTEQGRVRSIGRGHKSSHTYLVTDPEEWSATAV